MISSPRITTAPMGTSSLDAAIRACPNAAAIPLPIPHSPLLRTHRLPGLLEAQRIAVFRAVDQDAVALGVLPLEDRNGERILQGPLDRTLPGPGRIDQMVAHRD